MVKTELRTYQDEAVQIMLPRKRNLEYDDMGLGKTLTVLKHIEETHGDKMIANFLIVCGKKSLYGWAGEIEKHTDQKYIVYHGTPAQRKKIWTTWLNTLATHSYLITTYGMVQEVIDNTIRDKKLDRFAEVKLCTNFYWNYFAADEIHENGLLKHTNTTYKTVEKITRDIDYVTLLTGTPVRQGVIDCFAPLHIMDRYKFSNFYSYRSRHCNVIQGPFGQEVERNPRNPVEFRNVMSNYMVRRTKAELIARGDLKDLPGKQRQPVELEMNDSQQKIFDAMINDMFYVENGNLVIAPNRMVVDMRIRQLLVCPRMLGIDNNGVALDTIVETGNSLIDNGEPFVVFTPFRQAVPYIQQAIEAKIKNVRVYKIHGDMKPQDFAAQWKGFQTNPEKKKVMIIVIKSGSSFDAYAASYGFFLGYEEDFNLNTQAEDRLCRLGQHNFVNIYYMLHKGTIDEMIRQRLNDKQVASDWIIGTEERFNALLQRYKAAHNIGK